MTSINFEWPKEAVARLSKAGKERLGQRQTRLKFLLDKSREKLFPLGEPLELDLGVHRWLAHDREEAYSDWLAWLLRNLKWSEIKELFNVLAELESDSNSDFKVHREYPVSKGHEGATGRIDVFVEIPNKAALVLELKKGSVYAADTKKQEGYFQAIERNGMRCRYILLVTDQQVGEEEERHRFTVMPYATLCLRLRHWAAAAVKQNDPRGLTLVAMVLAFVGAIEANLLNLAITPIGLPSDAVLKHLSAFVEE